MSHPPTSRVSHVHTDNTRAQHARSVPLPLLLRLLHRIWISPCETIQPINILDLVAMRHGLRSTHRAPSSSIETHLVVLVLLSHAGQVHLDLDARALQHISRADPTAFEDTRRAQRSGTEYNLYPRLDDRDILDLGIAPLGRRIAYLQTRRDAIFKQHPNSGLPRQNGQIRSGFVVDVRPGRG